jgi:hypothetical protein
MGWDWGFKASCEMEVVVVDRNKKLLRFIKIRFDGAPIKSVSPVLNEFFKPKRVSIGKAKMPKQDPICGALEKRSPKITAIWPKAISAKNYLASALPYWAIRLAVRT